MKHSVIIKIKAMYKHSFFFLFAIILVITFVILDKIGYVCPFRLLGMYCAGCGGTRMVKAIFHLQFYQAFRYNPLLFIYFVLFIIYGIINLIFYFFKNKKLKLPLWVYVFLISSLVIYMIIRNIPYFSYLIPTEV